jgi:hypothetical protein
MEFRPEALDVPLVEITPLVLENLESRLPVCNG